jgi:hypothetical protein
MLAVVVLVVVVVLAHDRLPNTFIVNGPVIIAKPRSPVASFLDE